MFNQMCNLDELQDCLSKISVCESVVRQLDQLPESNSLFYMFGDKQIMERKCQAYKNLTDLYRVCVDKYFDRCNQEMVTIKQNLELDIRNYHVQLSLMEKEDEHQRTILTNKIDDYRNLLDQCAMIAVDRDRELDQLQKLPIN